MILLLLAAKEEGCKEKDMPYTGVFAVLLDVGENQLWCLSGRAFDYFCGQKYEGRGRKHVNMRRVHWQDNGGT
jgi:hypothetical protein